MKTLILVSTLALVISSQASALESTSPNLSYSHATVGNHSSSVNKPIQIESNHVVKIHNLRGHAENYPVSFTLESGNDKAVFNGSVYVRSHEKFIGGYTSKLMVSRDSAGNYPIVAKTIVGGESKSEGRADSTLVIN